MEPRPVVLLADDNADDVDIALLVMNEAGFPFEVLVARDGEEAWGLLQGLPGPPALLLLDIKMPRLGGLDLLERVRRELGWREVPVAILTSSDDVRDVARAESLGANAYILKPTDVRGFEAVVERLKDPASILAARMARW